MQALLAGGLQVTRLGLTWQDRIAFVLTDKLELKRVELLGIRSERGSEDEDDGEQDAIVKFDMDFALMSGELSRLLTGLDAAFAGTGALHQAAA